MHIKCLLRRAPYPHTLPLWRGEGGRVTSLVLMSPGNEVGGGEEVTSSITILPTAISPRQSDASRTPPPPSSHLVSSETCILFYILLGLTVGETDFLNLRKIIVR